MYVKGIVYIMFIKHYPSWEAGRLPTHSTTSAADFKKHPSRRPMYSEFEVGEAENFGAL